MSAEEYLSQMWWMNQEINSRIKELEELKAKLEGCSAPEITGMPKGQGGKDKISNLVIKIVDLQNYINMKTDGLIDMRKKITKQIYGIKDQRSRVILSCRYIRHEKWEDIERELNYERSHLNRLRKKALKQFEDTYPEIRKL